MFVDYLKVHVKAGDGGSGRISFRREKYAPRGGPNGGDGGRGGHVIFEADPKLGTLLDLQFRPNLIAKRGDDGGSNNCFGRDGEDIIVHVPQGTLVSDHDGNQLADLIEPGEQWIAAHAGRGGQGNTHFATATNKTPRYAQPGEPGEEKKLILELKLIAEVGLVGLPNAGKSTLLSTLTSATPKIASYPFTTLSPNLGVIEFDDMTRLTLADIPGLIEGASKGVGLGDRFLRHIERTKVLLHLLGDEEGVFLPEDMIYMYDLVRNELATYSPALASRKEIILITKIDLGDEEFLEATRAAFKERGLEPIFISSLEKRGLEPLKKILHKMAIEEEALRVAEQEARKKAREETIQAEALKNRMEITPPLPETEEEQQEAQETDTTESEQ